MRVLSNIEAKQVGGGWAISFNRQLISGASSASVSIRASSSGSSGSLAASGFVSAGGQTQNFMFGRRF